MHGIGLVVHALPSVFLQSLFFLISFLNPLYYSLCYTFYKFLLLKSVVIYFCCFMNAFFVQVVLEPALNDKLAYNQEADDGGANAIKGFLGQLRHDLTQVLIGQADEIPDYSSPPPKPPPQLTAGAGAAGAPSSSASNNKNTLLKGRSMQHESEARHHNASSDELSHMLHPLTAPSAHDKPKKEGRRAPRRYPPYDFEYRNSKHANWDI
jgi:hypothetical protein